jgi:hypothetical protein
MLLQAFGRSSEAKTAALSASARICGNTVSRWENRGIGRQGF